MVVYLWVCSKRGAVEAPNAPINDRNTQKETRRQRTPPFKLSSRPNRPTVIVPTHMIVLFYKDGSNLTLGKKKGKRRDAKTTPTKQKRHHPLSLLLICVMTKKAVDPHVWPSGLRRSKNEQQNEFDVNDRFHPVDKSLATNTIDSTVPWAPSLSNGSSS